jgi:predicted secreted protein
METLEHRTLLSVSTTPPVLFEDHYQFVNGITNISNVSILANDRDPTGDGLTASLLYGTQNGTLNLKADGNFTYKAKDGFVGTDMFFYRATASNGRQSIANVYITVAKNEDPADLFNVCKFGAKGDAITDDTMSIRAALAAAEAAGGGTIYFPSGTYMVSPQPSDADWPHLSDPTWFSKAVGEGIFHIGSSNIHFKGDGAGQSTISVKTIDPQTGKTGADPSTTWTVVPVPGSSQQLVFRGAAFRIGVGNQTLDNISFTGLRITGNTLATNDQTVGGNPTTGTGWDMSHKAIAVNSGLPVKILIEDCRLDGWRGETVYSGGTAASKITIRRSLIEECNASAIATSAFTTIEDSIIRNVYNGTENYCLGVGQGLVINNTIFETTRAGSFVHGVVYEGGKGVGATMTVTNCTFKGFKRDIYIAGGAEDVSITDSTFQDGATGIFIGAAGNNKIFRNLSFIDNTFNFPQGVAIVLNSYRIPMSNVLIQGNTVSGKIFISDSAIVRDGLIIQDNIISSDTIYVIEAGGVSPALWINNQYVYNDVLWRHFKAVTDRTDVKAGQATISPSREACAVQLLGGGNVVINLSQTVKYPTGYTVNIMRYGDTRGTMQIIPASWNTLTEPITVSTSGVTLRYRSDGKFELAPAVVTLQNTQTAALLSYVKQSTSATTTAINELAQLRVKGL